MESQQCSCAAVIQLHGEGWVTCKIKYRGKRNKREQANSIWYAESTVVRERGERLGKRMHKEIVIDEGILDGDGS